MTKRNEKESTIPKLDLNKFDFTPPGPMGWSYSEYEMTLDNPDLLVPTFSNDQNHLDYLRNLPLIEYPLNGTENTLEKHTKYYQGEKNHKSSDVDLVSPITDIKTEANNTETANLFSGNTETIIQGKTEKINENAVVSKQKGLVIYGRSRRSMPRKNRCYRTNVIFRQNYNNKRGRR
ncbi:hypothetical protein V7138_08890 [Bacillus sp. JJ1533]|uniref:hypothetical protein n=1 Tax=Bacillus sp. JJ1533 TaxID=3122959 RepID=UPI002FFF9388